VLAPSLACDSFVPSLFLSSCVGCRVFTKFSNPWEPSLIGEPLLPSPPSPLIPSWPILISLDLLVMEYASYFLPNSNYIFFRPDPGPFKLFSHPSFPVVGVADPPEPEALGDGLSYFSHACLSRPANTVDILRPLFLELFLRGLYLRTAGDPPSILLFIFRLSSSDTHPISTSPILLPPPSYTPGPHFFPICVTRHPRRPGHVNRPVNRGTQTPFSGV